MQSMCRASPGTEIDAPAAVTLCGVAFDGARQPLVQLAQFSSVLSHVWIQLAVLVGVGLILPGTRRALAPPTAGIDRAVQSPIRFGNFAREDLRKGASDAAQALGMLILMWYFFPKSIEMIFLSVWLVSYGSAVLNWWECTVHVQLSRDWIFGIAQDREQLGRRAAARVVWMSLPWLVLGTGWSGIHAFATAPAEGFFLKEVLLVHIAALLVATVLCHLTRRLPPSFPFRLCVYLSVLAFGACVSRECMRVLCVLRLPCGGLRVAYLRADRHHSIDRVPGRSRPGASGGPDGDSRSSSR